MKRLGSREPRIEKDRDRAKKDKDLLRSRKNSRIVLRDKLMDDKPKRGDWSRRKGPLESPNDKIRIKRSGI